MKLFPNLVLFAPKKFHHTVIFFPILSINTATILHYIAATKYTNQHTFTFAMTGTCICGNNFYAFLSGYLEVEELSNRVARNIRSVVTVVDNNGQKMENSYSLSRQMNQMFRSENCCNIVSKITYNAR